MKNLVLPPDAPPAHRFLAHWFPYIRSVCRRHAQRLGLEAEDLEHDIAVLILKHFEHIAQRGLDPAAYAKVRVRGWLMGTFVTRWKRYYRGPQDTDLDQRSEGRLADPSEQAEERELVAKVLELIPQLHAKRRAALIRRFGLDGGQQLVGVDLARELGVTRAHTSELVHQALCDLALMVGADPDLAGVRVRGF